MTKKTKDPYWAREKEKYDDPVPSREYIMQILDDYGRPMSKNQLIDALGIESESKQDALGFRLKAMLRDGQLMQDRRNRFCLLQKLNLKRGKVQGHPDGFGFVIFDTDEPDMFLSAREMREVMNGDVVLAYQTGFDRRGRPEGKIHEVVEHANATVVGRYFEEHGVGILVPDNKRLTQDISIPSEYAAGAKNGQVVLAEMLAYPGKRNQGIGRIIHILGDHMAPGMEIQVAIHAHNIPYDWPDDVLAEVSRIPQKVTQEDLKGRKDLRDLPLVTIDGEDARDFDDAVYCRKIDNGGWQLIVAIADVSHYVKPKSALDMEASRRGNSVYFPEKVVPMLPEALSNGLCSLNPHVDRLCMVAEMTISADGKISRSRFYRAVMHSKARLTYTKVGQWLSNNEADESHQAVFPMIQELYKLYLTLQKTRHIRGAIDFETTETSIVFDEQKKIKAIKPVVRNDAHKLIEECMLAANVAVARHLSRAKIPILYRVHEVPDEEKITMLRQFLSEIGLKLGNSKNPTPKDFQQVMAAIKERPDRHLLETIMLRSLKQAQYREVNEGHFGLAYPAYTHFTSPIRRYPDLLVHRAIGHLADKQEANTFGYSTEDMARLGKNSSMTERRADEAVREVISWLKCEYMQDKLGQAFSGRISSVTGFGIFVELDEVYVEGLVHVTSLDSDYYRFDSVRHRLVGERSGKVYSLGDRMNIVVARVDLDERKIDFELAENVNG